MGILGDFLGGGRYGQIDDLKSDGWLFRAVGGQRTAAGVAVSEYTARQLPVVYACVNRIANPIAGFPLAMYRRMPDGTRRQVEPDEHPFAKWIGMRPNEYMSSRTLRKTVQSHALLWGNGYCEIERNGRGQAVGLFPLLPDRTRPVLENGARFYRTKIDGKQVDIENRDVIHVMDQSQDGYVGISQIAMARQAIGMGFAMEEFGGKFFANDMKSGGFLMHPGKLTGNARDNMKGRNGEQKPNPASPASPVQSQGGLENAHKVKVLEEGMKFIQTTIPPEDAQFLGTRDFQNSEIARIYDVPLILLQMQDKQTSFGSGIEQLMIAFVTSTIGPWTGSWEEEYNYKLFTDDEIAQGYYVKHNMNAILRGDMASRREFYKDMFGVGAFAPNRILSLEDEDGIGPMGDHHFVPANYVTLEKATNPDYQPTGAASATTATAKPAPQQEPAE